MEFVWNDGGRAACGYVGFTSDCATRAIAIATGAVYRDVYEQLGNLADHSPRLGLSANLARDFLAKHNWQLHPAKMPTFDGNVIPKGVVIVHAAKDSGKSHHLCSVIDHVVHDTWNPSDDVQYQVLSFWTRPAFANVDNLPTIAPRRPTSNEQELTQAEFDKILHRLKALDRTATNSGSTEAEKHNALRMMQNLMLRHNLSREEIVDGDNVESVRFTRIACPVNGRRTCQLEHSLAWYISQHIFTTTQYYYSTEGHRAMFWFYGPVDDVNNAIALFRELLLTIATAAHLQFGGYARGSGASYAEGYAWCTWHQLGENLL